MPQTNSAGVDWAKEEHAVCVVDEAGRPLSERRFAHDERGLCELCRSLTRRGVERVAIERPEGILVERLLEAGLLVLAVHPNQLKAARPRFRAAGGKSDAFDAFCLAELAQLRYDHHRFRALVPDSEETRGCYEPAMRMPAACCRKRQANATKCNPATVSGSLS